MSSKYFHKNGCFSHVTDQFCLFVRYLRKSQHLWICVYFRKQFPRKCTNDFRGNFRENAKKKHFRFSTKN